MCLVSRINTYCIQTIFILRNVLDLIYFIILRWEDPSVYVSRNYVELSTCITYWTFIVLQSFALCSCCLACYPWPSCDTDIWYRIVNMRGLKEYTARSVVRGKWRITLRCLGWNFCICLHNFHTNSFQRYFSHLTIILVKFLL